MTVGTRVWACAALIQKNHMGKKLHTHARKGDAGTVTRVHDDGTADVRFDRTGTIYRAVLVREVVEITNA